MRLQDMAPAFVSTLVGNGVVPVTNVIDVRARREGGPRGDADWTVCIRVAKPGPTGCKPVEIWRLNKRISGRSHVSGVMLIRHDD